jgi:hypothetical protein
MNEKTGFLNFVDEASRRPTRIARLEPATTSEALQHASRHEFFAELHRAILAAVGEDLYDTHSADPSAYNSEGAYVIHLEDGRSVGFLYGVPRLSPDV